MITKKYKDKVFTSFYFSLRPHSTKNFSTKDKYWNFSNLKRWLESIKGIKQDSSINTWGNFDNECFYSYSLRKEKICFKINGGYKKYSDSPSIFINFSERHPSKNIFKKSIEIIKFLGKSQNKLEFKIYASMKDNFVDIDYLSILNKSFESYRKSYEKIKQEYEAKDES